MECARGCTVAAGLEEDAPRVPAVADPGAVLCGQCLARLRWRLDDLSDVAARARVALVPTVGVGGGERVSGSKDPKLPFNLAALEVSDGLVALLAGWCIEWAGSLQLAPPRGLSREVDPSRVLGVRAGTDAERVADAIEAWVVWVRLQWPLIVAHERAAAFHDGIVDGVSRALGRFPRDEERVVQQRARYCPVCGVVDVKVSWPAGSRDPLVACGSCGWEFEREVGDLLGSIGV